MVAVMKKGSTTGRQPSEILSEIKKTELMFRAAKLGPRPPLLSAIFEVSNERAREIYKQVLGVKPTGGRGAENTEWFVSTVKRHIQSVWLCRMYESHTKDATSKLHEIEALLLTYEAYIEEFSEAERQIDFDRYFFLIRMSAFAKDIKVKHCDTCGGSRLEVKKYRFNRSNFCPCCCLVFKK